ncbi:DUF397 domain-containing protein [Streptomyces chrestomyceticus]|uniref:DUF397 domain-containing protein n=1 Tax=Streptomyces chrestomyceticus TaxID=68185 RepID=UPI0033E4A4C2
MTNDITIRNGMPASDLGTEGWHKPWSGPNGGTCLEVKPLADGYAMRQSTDPTGPALVLTNAEMQAFVDYVKTGAADELLLP